MPKLDIRIGHHARQQVDINKPQIWIGSDESCDVFLREPGVSRFHAQLHVDEQGRFWLQDAGGSFGTLLNGRDIEREQLFEGDEITLGRIKILFHEEGAPYRSGLSLPPQIAGLQLPAPAPHPPHPLGSLPPALRDASLHSSPPLGSLFPPEPHEQNTLPPSKSTAQSASSPSEPTAQSASSPFEPTAQSASLPPESTEQDDIAMLHDFAYDADLPETTESSAPSPLSLLSADELPAPPPTSPSSSIWPEASELATNLPTHAFTQTSEAEPEASELATDLSDHHFTKNNETVITAYPSASTADDSHAFLDGLMSSVPSIQDLDRDFDAVMSNLPHTSISPLANPQKSPSFGAFAQAIQPYIQPQSFHHDPHGIVLPIQEEDIPAHPSRVSSTHTQDTQDAQDIWQKEQTALGLFPSSLSNETASYGLFPSAEDRTQPAAHAPPHLLAPPSAQTSPLSLNETIAHILSHAPQSRHELSSSFHKGDVWASEADRLRGLLRQREEETSTLQERLRLQAQQHRDLMNTTLQRYREENEQLQRQIAFYDQMRLEQTQMLQALHDLEEAKQRLLEENQRLRAENQAWREDAKTRRQQPPHAPTSPDNPLNHGLPPQAAKNS